MHPLGMPKGLANGHTCSVKQSPSHKPLTIPYKMLHKQLSLHLPWDHTSSWFVPINESTWISHKELMNSEPCNGTLNKNHNVWQH